MTQGGQILENSTTTDLIFIACSAPLSSENIPLTHEGGSLSSNLMPLNDIDSEVELKTFLERRIYVTTQTWAIGSAFSYTVNPFDVYFSSSDIQDKIAGYSLFRCDFEIEIFVKGTRYHAGLLMASVRRYGTENTRVVVGQTHQLVSYSQRPHIFLEAGTSQSSSITVPFVYPAGWWPIGEILYQSLPDPNTSRVYISSLANLAALTSATSPVEVSIYLKAKNISYAAPTKVNYAGTSDEGGTIFEACADENKKKKKKKTMHRKDEYQEQIQVSGVASALASAAGMLGSVPVIGPFALATEIGLNAVSGIARLFGYSRPAIIKDMTITRPQVVGSLSLSEGGDPVQKLTLTAKQEVTVDPTTLGLPPVDEMSLDFLTKKESYLTSFEWDPTDATNTAIFNIAVDPMLYRVSGSDRYMTSLAFATQHFRYWSGTLRFRFVIIGTSFHSGKLAFVHEPAAPAVPTATDRYTRLNYEILDLDSERDITLDVRWAQADPYRPTHDLSYAESVMFTAPGTTMTTLTKNSNGFLSVFPFTGLVSPDDITPVQVLVFVSAGDDYEVNGVGEPGRYQSPFPAWVATADDEKLIFVAASDEGVEPLPGAEEFAEEGSPNTVVLGGTPNDIDEKAIVHYGERPTSLRQLMKRPQYYRTVYVPGAANVDYYFKWYAFPAAYGKSTSTNWDATTAVVGSAFTFNKLTTFASVGIGYGMWRGSYRYRFIPVQGNATLTACRLSLYDGSPEAVEPGNISTTTSSKIATRGETYGGEYDSGGGLAIAVQSVNGALEFELPYYSPLRASNVTMAGRSSSLTTGLHVGPYIGFRCYDAKTPTRYNTYVSGGDDFAFYCFNGAGTVSWQATIPTT